MRSQEGALLLFNKATSYESYMIQGINVTVIIAFLLLSDLVEF
jgi:hypothetical protein